MARRLIFAVLQEADRHFFRDQAHVHGLQDHLGCVFPGLRAQIHAQERVFRDAAHAAVDVGKPAREDRVEDPCRDRGSEVAVERRHRAGLDVAAEA
jgi:hypothetical protein